MVMSYHQIELAPGEGPKSAFSNKHGHWEYRRLPFGLKTGPATFQKLINSVLSGLTGTRFCVFGRYRHLCQIAGGSQYQVTRGVRWVANAQAEITA